MLRAYTTRGFPVTEQLVERPTKAIYRAGRTDLRLVKKRRRPIRDPQTSEVIGVTEGQVVAFTGGVVEIPLEGVVTLRDSADAGSCELPADEVLKWLDKHRLNGNPYEGFIKVEVAAPAPSQAELERLMAAAWDEDALVAIIEQERAGWARDAIVRTAEGALSRLREAMEAAREKGEREARERAELEQRAAAKPKPKA